MQQMNLPKNYQTLFDLYADKRSDCFINTSDFKLILQSLGFSAEAEKIDEKLKPQTTWNEYAVTMNRLSKLNEEEERLSILLDLYANEEGMLTKDAFREMLINHVDDLTPEEIEKKVNFQFPDNNTVLGYRDLLFYSVHIKN